MNPFKEQDDSWTHSTASRPKNSSLPMSNPNLTKPSYKTDPFKDLTSGYLGAPSQQTHGMQQPKAGSSTSTTPSNSSATYTRDPFAEQQSPAIAGPIAGPLTAGAQRHGWLSDHRAGSSAAAIAKPKTATHASSLPVPAAAAVTPIGTCNTGFEDDAFGSTTTATSAAPTFISLTASTTTSQPAGRTVNPFAEADFWPSPAPAPPAAAQQLAAGCIVDDVFGILPAHPRPASTQAATRSQPPTVPNREPPPPPYAVAVQQPSVMDHPLAFQPLRNAAMEVRQAAPSRPPPQPPSTPPRQSSPFLEQAMQPQGSGANPFRQHSPVAGQGSPVSKPSAALERISGSSPKHRRDNSSSVSGSGKALANSCEPAPMCMDVRLPPLRPVVGSHGLKVLATINNSLLAAPIQKQGSAMLQWVIDGDNLTAPTEAAPQDQQDRDKDSAPCGELQNYEAYEEVVCVLPDDVSGCVWTGHQDGRVSCWRAARGPGSALQPLHVWQAHKLNKITALAVSAWGDVFTGSESGSIRIWSYDDGIDTQAPVRSGEIRRNSGARPHAKVVALALSSGGRVLWSAGKSSLCLWDAYTGEALGAIKDARSGAGLMGEDEGSPGGDAGASGDGSRGLADMWAKNQKRGEDVNIDPARGVEAAQRRRAFRARRAPEPVNEDEDGNLADRVRQTAGKLLRGAFKRGKKLVQGIQESRGAQDLNKEPSGSSEQGAPDQPRPTTHYGSIKALVATPLATVWVAYKKGLVECFSEWGRLLNSFELPKGASALVVVGSQVWAGGRDGRLYVFDAGGELLRSWSAHMYPVQSLAAAGSVVYSLSRCGAIKAWSAVPITPDASTAWQAELGGALKQQRVRMLAGTWNVGESKPDPDALKDWLRKPSKDADMVVVGLQEIEMGAQSVARDAAYSYFQRSQLERGNAVAQAWAEAVAGAIGDSFSRIALRKLSGMLLLVFTRSQLAGHCGEVSTASVACGFRGIGGNKGAVAVSLSMYRRLVVLVASHFAAHQEAVEERCDNYRKIVAHLKFGDGSRLAATVGGTNGGAGADLDAEAGGNTLGDEDVAETVGPGMSEAELLLWMGDFNFRIDTPYHAALRAIKAGNHRDLLQHDQLLLERARERVFKGLTEPPIDFPPTYKFEKREKWDPSDPPYDRSEKQRVPAWTDRVLFRGSNRGEAGERVVVEALSYNANMHVVASDHKPVWADLQVMLPAYQQSLKRQIDLKHLLRAAGETGAAAGQLPRLTLSSQSLQLRADTSSVLTLTNQGPGRCEFVVAGAGGEQSHLPLWASVQPWRGCLDAGQSLQLEVSVAAPSYMVRSSCSATLRVWAGAERMRGSSSWQLLRSQPGLSLQLVMTG